jgi:hypothetical protein
VRKVGNIYVFGCISSVKFFAIIFCLTIFRYLELDNRYFLREDKTAAAAGIGIVSNGRRPMCYVSRKLKKKAGTEASVWTN